MATSKKKPSKSTKPTKKSKSDLVWTHTKGDHISAPLSYTEHDHYVISHRRNQHTVSYRPPGQHHHVGQFETEEEAFEAVERHRQGAMPLEKTEDASEAIRRHRQRKKSNPRTQVDDEHEARELELWIDNTRELYDKKRAIEVNLARHMRKGRYDAQRAADGFMYVVDEGARDYKKRFPAGPDYDHKEFNKATRRAVAEDFARRFEIEYGINPQDYVQRNPGRQYDDIQDWPYFVMDSVINFLSQVDEDPIPEDTPNDITPELREAIERYENLLAGVLGEIVAEIPPKSGQDFDDVWNADATYNVFMTLNGEGVGIWDGRWDHLYSDADLKRVKKLLKHKLGDVADDTGGGWLNEAFETAAYANAENEREENPSVADPAPAVQPRMTAIAARLARGLS